MKKILIATVIIAAIFTTSCTKERIDPPKQTESTIKVQLYAVPVNADGVEGKATNIAIVTVKN